MLLRYRRPNRSSIGLQPILSASIRCCIVMWLPSRDFLKCYGDAYVMMVRPFPGMSPLSNGSSAGNTDRKWSFSASLRASMPREAPVCNRTLPAWKDYKCWARWRRRREKRSQYGPVFHLLVFIPTLALISISKSTHSHRESSSTGRTHSPDRYQVLKTT